MSKAAKLSLLILVVLLVGSLIFGGLATVEKDKLTQVNTKLKKDLTQSQQKEKQTLQQVSDLRTELDALTRKSNDEQRKLNDQIVKLEREKNDLNKQVASFETEKDNLRQRIDEARRDRDQLVKKVQDAEQRIKSMQQEMDKQAKAVTAPASKTPEISQQAKAPAPRPSTMGADRSNDEYWASVLREKAELEIELQKIKSQLSQTQMDIVEFKRMNDEYKVRIDQLEHDKTNIEQEIQYKTELINNIYLELARTKNDKKFIADRAESLNKENTELRDQMKQLVKTKGALEKTIVKLTKEKNEISQKIGQTDTLIQSKIDEIWEIKESIDRAFQSTKNDVEAVNEVELPPIVVKSDGPGVSFNPGPAAAGMNGKILSVNEPNNFVIVDLGQNSGVNVGDQLSVYRGSQYVARLQVIQVRNDISAADIKDQWSKIQIGDLIR
jgi:chromosome segregation ATPase